MTPAAIERRKRYNASPAGKAAKKRQREAAKLKHGAKLIEWKADYNKKWREANRDKQRSYQAKYAAANPDKIKRAYRRKLWREAKLPRVRQLIQILYKLAPRNSGYDDIVANAALYVMEGFEISEAVKLATKQVNKEFFGSKKNQSLEDCFWL